MQTARIHSATAWAAALVVSAFLAGARIPTAAALDDDSPRPFPTGRVLGTGYFGPALDWQDPSVRAEILVADFLVLGNGLHARPAYAGFADAMHAEKPSLKILQHLTVPWIFDTCNSPDPPGSRPCEEVGQGAYDLFYPQDIAHMAVANPSEAVRDTAFMTYGTYMIDFDNPGVAEALAQLIYDYVMTGLNPDIDGVNLDFFDANWGGWALYGNSPGELGYTGHGDTYWIDYDRDGVPSNLDADERMAVRDAYGRFVNRLRALFGPNFLIAGNGPDALWGTTMSDGNQFHDLLDIRQRELFPWGWSVNDYFLPAFDLVPSSVYGGQDMWELADAGRHHPAVPTPQGNYILLDTLNGPNGPWICLSALMLDNAIPCIAGNNMNEGRTDWWAGDPMPLLENLGEAAGPPVRDGNLWSREFAGGSIHLNFTNSPAELYIEPYNDGDINAPNGPFKYLVLGTTMGDTLYRGGGWPRATAGGEAGAQVHIVDFEDTRWTVSFGGGNAYAARVTQAPRGGLRSLRGNLKPGLQDPIAHVTGNPDPLLEYDAGGLLADMSGDIFLRYWWRWDGFTWDGTQPGCGVSAALVDATTGEPALNLLMGYLPPPGRGGPSGGELEIQLAPDFASWGLQNWGDTVARLGSAANPTLLPLDDDWHEVGILMSRGAGLLTIWIDGLQLDARPGDANAEAHYPDGRLPLPASFRWSALRFASAASQQVNLSTDGTGYAVGWQLDDIGLFSGYSPNPGRPGRPLVEKD
jgi:hypothetical protein